MVKCLRMSCTAAPTTVTGATTVGSQLGIAPSVTVRSLKNIQARSFVSMIDDIGKKDWRARGDLQPAPRNLSDVVKLPLLKREDSMTVKKIWLDHHLGNTDESTASTSLPVVATTLDAGEYNLLRSRAAICPFFVLPVQRDQGHFVILVQWQDNVCLFTFLEEYKKNPHGAEPWAAMTMYSELVPTHDLALSRTDYNPLHLTKIEAQRLMELVRIYYVESNQYQVVEDFNHHPDCFDWEKHIRECR